jgi:mannosyltransferase
VAPPPLRMGLVLALTVPFVLAHQGIRREDSRPWNAAALAAVVRHEGRPGDGLLFDADPCRTIRAAYPRVFAPLTDVELGMPAAQRGRLHGGRVPEAVAVQRLKRLKRVWVISCRHLSAGGLRLAAQAAARHRRALSAAGPFTAVRYRAVRGLSLTLYGRTASGQEGWVEQVALIAIENR